MSTPGAEYLAEASRELDEALDGYLERSLTAAEAFLTETHVAWGIPKGHDKPVVLFTAYRPDPGRWDETFMRRQ